MKLNLGCGKNLKEGYVGVDVIDYSDIFPKGKFVKADLFKEFPFDDNSIEEVYAAHFIEHIPQDRVIWFFNEVYRILIPSGIFEIHVPPTQSPDGKACRGAFADPTHRSYWNDLSFRYFDMSWKGAYGIKGNYGIKCNFKQVKVEFIHETNLHVILQKV